MTNRCRRLTRSILACAVILGCSAGREAAAQGKPTGPPRNPDGYLAVAVVFDDNGTRIVKSDKVVVQREKRVDFYLLNLTNDRLAFSITFKKDETPAWICEEDQGSSGRDVGARTGDGSVSCRLKKAVVDRICGQADPCYVDFAYKVTRAGSTDVIVADPQLEIRR